MDCPNGDVIKCIVNRSEINLQRHPANALAAGAGDKTEDRIVDVAVRVPELGVAGAIDSSNQPL
jgi:hypothetical protein